MHAYPRPVPESTYFWEWELREIHNNARVANHIGPLRHVGEERHDMEYRPRQDPTNTNGPWLSWDDAHRLERQMFEHFNENDPVQPPSPSRNHVWPGQPGYGANDDTEYDEVEVWSDGIRFSKPARPRKSRKNKANKGCKDDDTPKRKRKDDSDDEEEGPDTQTPTKGANPSRGRNEPTPSKKVRLGSNLNNSAIDAKTAVGPETPTKKARKQPAYSVQRGKKTDKDAPPLMIKLPSVDITTIEALTFLPELTEDAAFIERLASNQWLVHVVTVILNEVREWPSHPRKMHTRSTVIGRYRKAFTTLEPTKAGTWQESAYKARTPSATRVTDYSTSYFNVFGDESVTKDVYISSLLVKVTAFPTGIEAGLLTQAVELIRAHPEYDCLLSKLGDLAVQHGLTAPPYTVSEDKESLAKWKAIASTKHTKAYGDIPLNTPQKKGRTRKQVAVEQEELGSDADAEGETDEEVIEQDGGVIDLDSGFGNLHVAAPVFGGYIDSDSETEFQGQEAAVEEEEPARQVITDEDWDAFDRFDQFGMFNAAF